MYIRTDEATEEQFLRCCKLAGIDEDIWGLAGRAFWKKEDDPSYVLKVEEVQAMIKWLSTKAIYAMDTKGNPAYPEELKRAGWRNRIN